MVDRRGSSSKAFMKTTRIITEIVPGQCYKLTRDSLALTTELPTLQHKKSVLPPHFSLKGKWTHSTKKERDKSSILGDIGPFISQNKIVEIPIAATLPETLSYYGAQLLHKGDRLRFETKVALPLFAMHIGDDYIQDYMLQKRHANGIFLEYHDKPHFHMPLDTHAKGFLILGKKITQELYHLSAFAIPYMSAIYTPPDVIHNDSFLIGKYAVVYSQTDDFSTVRLLNSSQEILPTTIIGD